MFDSRIFYLQMAGSRNRPQVVHSEMRRDTRIPAPRASRHGRGH
jgi:hypothetical protein